MSRSAWIKQADMKRMAAIAKEYGVRVEVEIEGKIFRIAPDHAVQEDGSEVVSDSNPIKEWLHRRSATERSRGRTILTSAESPTGRGGYPIADDPKDPLKQWYDKLGFDPRTMDEKDMVRLQEKAEAEWKAALPGTKILKRERNALEKLAAIGVGVPVPAENVKGCGWETTERLEARGFIGRRELLPPEKVEQGYSLDEIWLLEPGLEALRRLEAAQT